MEPKPEHKIGFFFKKIITEQFAVFEEAHKENAEYELTVGLKFAVDKPDKVVAIHTSFQFQIENNPFIKLDSICEFLVEESTWDSFITANNILVLPKKFMSHLAVLCVGTARGILHAKTESTKFNGFVIPTINLTELIDGDLSIDLNTGEPVD